MSSQQQQHEQLLTIHHNDDNNNEIKRPSSTLEQLTEECVSTFGRLNNSVNKALEQGRKEGFADREVGDMIRAKLLAAGIFKDDNIKGFTTISKEVRTC